MSKLHRVVEKDEAEETMQIDTPILTSKSKVDLSVATLGDIELECTNCATPLVISRGLGVNISCQNCGNKKFISRSNFTMGSLDDEKVIKIGERLDGSRGGTGIWTVR